MGGEFLTNDVAFDCHGIPVGTLVVQVADCESMWDESAEFRLPDGRVVTLYEDQVERIR